MAAAPGEAADPMAAALRAAAVQSAALVLISAAQHLQRTTMLVEAATARVLARAAGEGDPDADHGLVVARTALAEAMGLFETAQARALALTAELGGT